jgi:hypothetical protein
MIDEDLADTLIKRLNDLCTDPEVRADLGKLIEWRAPCSKATAEHPTIQTQAAQPLDPAFDVLLKLIPSLTVNEGPTVGFLGFLNGLVGAIPGGKLQGWGYIAAVFDDGGQLTHFRRSDKP